MPILKGSASDFTSTVKGSAEVNASIGGAVAKGGNSNPPRSSGAIAAIVTQSAIAKSSGLQPTKFRVVASTAPAPAPVPAAPTFASIVLTNSGSSDIFVVKYNTDGGLNWARRIGGASGDQGLAIATDSSGNVYVTGYCGGSASIFGINETIPTFSLGNTGGNDTFIVKYNTEGTPLWVRRIAGTSDDRGKAIATDSFGNVYASGMHTRDAKVFDADGTSTAFTLLYKGWNDAFVVKYDTTGKPLWARRMAGAFGNDGFSLETDLLGNVYLAGYYASGAGEIFEADKTTVLLSLPTSSDNVAVVVKFDTAGQPLWGRIVGTIGDDYGIGVAVDSSGNVFFTGHCNGSAKVFAADGVSTAFTLSTSGGDDIFVVKYSTSGTPLWARRIASATTNVPTDITTDLSGNVYVSGMGTFTTTSVFTTSDGTSASFTLANSGGTDGFIVKYNTDGGALWARRIGGSAGDLINGISTDMNGNVYATGYIGTGGATVFAANGTTPVFSLTSAGGEDGFVVKYDTDGTPLWNAVVASAGNDRGQGITADKSGNIYATGFYTTSSLTIYSKAL